MARETLGAEPDPVDALLPHGEFGKNLENPEKEDDGISGVLKTPQPEPP